MRRWSTLVLLFATPLAAAAQDALAKIEQPPTAPPGTASTTSAVATRAVLPPLIDGSDADPIWARAQVIDSFLQFVPKENATATFRTAAKIAYDDRYLYVFVRLFDPHPDSIIGLLARRDQKTQSDWIKILIDSYHDKRTGYAFAVNPRGVKRDYSIVNDQEEDDSWDGTWDVVARVDSLGWAAEFRIPFNQLRFAPKPQLTMGFAIARDIARLNERDSWPVFRLSKPGYSSQFGVVSGIDGLGAPTHLEIVPYVVTKNITYPHPDSSYGRQQQFELGGDIKYGLTSNITLDGTVNPDFGQVESDPAVLNLTNLETFLPERRPFFVEGTGIFRFDMNCLMHACSGLFYSRRIGRQPQLTNGAVGTPTVTSIVAAAKLTGRTGGGLSIGVLDALTAREENAPDGLGIITTAEPATNYFATQVVQEFRDGQTQLGVMVTAVDRQLDQITRDSLRQEAYATGVHFSHQFAGRKYQLQASVVGSRVSGSAPAMAITQASSTHYYQRPGSGLVYDTTRTSLTGDAEKLSFGKIGGGVFHFNTNLSRVSPGVEINDLGYLAEAGVQSWSTMFSLDFQDAKSFYRQMYLDVGESNGWTTQGISGTYLNSNYAYFSGDVQLKNSWWLHGGVSFNRLLGSFDDRKARGGPALFVHPYTDGWLGFDGDPRLGAIPSVRFSAYDGSGGLSHGWSLSPTVLFHFSSNLALSVGLQYALDWNYVEWLSNLIHTDATTGVADTVVTIATRHQNTASAIIRFDATFTPRLSLQFYAQPFVSSGRYEHWRRDSLPRATSYRDEFVDYTPIPADNPTDTTACPTVTVSCFNFDYQQLNVNTVLRWEYRPGSTLFVVWTHGRNFNNYDQQYSGYSPGTDANHLFAVHPMNTFLIKATYWISL